MPATYFRTSRCIELSLQKSIAASLATSWDDITVVKSYPNFAKATTLPIVSIQLLNKNRIPREVGSRSDLSRSEFNIMINLFAKDEASRLDLADTLEEIIVADINYYLFSRPSGGGAGIDSALAGKLIFSRFLQNTQISFSEEVEKFDQHRHLLNPIFRIVLTS